MTVQEVMYMMADEGAYFHIDENGAMSIRCEVGRKIGGFLRGMLLIHKSEMKREVMKLKEHVAHDLKLGRLVNLRPPPWDDRMLAGAPAAGVTPPPGQGSFRARSPEAPTGEVGA